MNMTNPWDKVSDKFNTYKKEVWYGAADNIDSVWPVLLNYIKQKFPDPQGLKALDFGCGTGMFCRELKKLGFVATGLDISPEMVKIGRENLGPGINLEIGDTKTAEILAEKEGKFDLITSIMVLQFIEEGDITQLASAIAPKGHLIFAGHNPERLIEKGRTKTFTLSDTDVTVPIFVRTAENYDKIFMNSGFKKTLENFVQSSDEFLKKYHVTRDEDIPKYMILGYEKT